MKEEKEKETSPYVFVGIKTGEFNLPYSDARFEKITQSSEQNTQEDVIISEGYVDMKKSIQDKILAGELLNSSRYFDDEEALTNEEYALKIAKIRHPNTDVTEIQTYTEYVNQKFEKAKSEAERRAIAQSADLEKRFSSYEQPTQETPPNETQEKVSTNAL